MLAYFYHDNSDSVFIDHHQRDFGPVESGYILKIGLCFHANMFELKKRYKARKKRWGGISFKLNWVSIDYTRPYLPF